MPDHDGITNYKEYMAGTDPTSSQSRLTVKTFTPAPGGGLTFMWNSVSAKNYTIERSTDLQSWTVLQNNQTGTGATMSFTDTTPGSNTKLIYRIQVAQP